jgi:hypothetical protein
MTRADLKPPLTNLQHLLLPYFAREISEEDVAELRGVIARYFAEKAIKKAGEHAEKMGYTNEDYEAWANDPNT